MATSCVYQVSHACHGRVINEQAYTQKVNLRTCEFKKERVVSPPDCPLIKASVIWEEKCAAMERAQISKRPECEVEKRQKCEELKDCTDRQS